MKRTCCTCKKEKDLTEFVKYPRNHLGYGYQCKQCLREYSKARRAADPARREKQKVYELKRRYKKYNITPEEYAQRYQQQEGKCSICKTFHRLLHIDHDHSTGKFRGLLCRGCNVGLGIFKDNAEWLQNAIAYISD